MVPLANSAHKFPKVHKDRKMIRARLPRFEPPSEKFAVQSPLAQPTGVEPVIAWTTISRGSLFRAFLTVDRTDFDNNSSSPNQTKSRTFTSAL